MPCYYVIDKERRVVISTGSGRLTFDEIKAHQDQLLSDPDFNPKFNQLMDGTGLTDFALSVDQIRIVVSRKLFSPTSRRALVVTSTFLYGIGRMVQTYYEMSKTASPMSIFRDLPSALKWLGLENMPDLTEAETKTPSTAKAEKNDEKIA